MVSLLRPSLTVYLKHEMVPTSVDDPATGVEAFFCGL
jgi:hypothetical protein